MNNVIRKQSIIKRETQLARSHRGHVNYPTINYENMLVKIEEIEKISTGKERVQEAYE